MKALSILSLFFFLQSNIFAQRAPICFSHGECQERIGVQKGSKCLIVKTGTDVFGKTQCTLRCYPVLLGSKCRFIQDRPFGVCEKEKFKMPRFNPGKPNCKNAIDPDIIGL